MVFAVRVGGQTEPPQTCGNTGIRPDRILLTVIDQVGEFPSNLKMEDLTLKLNDVPTPVVGLALETGKPLDVAILIDASLSQEESLPVSKRVATALIQMYLDPARDRLALISFSNDIQQQQPLTADFAKVVTELEAIKITVPPGYVGGGVVVGRTPPPRVSQLPGSTSLWDVVAQAIEKVYGREKSEGRRRAIILLTDGEDTSSQSRLSEAIRIAIDRDVLIHALGIRGRDNTLSRGSLNKISEETGGVAIFLNSQDSKPVLNEIGKQLRSQYVVSFCRVTQPAHWEKVRFEISNPQFRKARLGYRRQTK